jgi:8-oxo-dGTP pyrophosphatase MutT (NUDIX family)
MAQSVSMSNRARPVTSVVVYRPVRGGYEYLILRRHPDEQPYPGKWTVPSGGLEVETYPGRPKTSDGWENVYEDAGRDEVREEAGVEIGKLAYMGSFLFFRAHDNVPVVGVRFCAPYVGGEVTLDTHHIDSAWVRIDGLDAYDLLANLADEIRKVDQDLRKKAAL